MALGSKKGDYKTWDRSRKETLKRHYERMQELIETGMDEKDASRAAYIEITRTRKGR